MLEKIKRLGSDQRVWAWLAMLLWGAVLLTTGLLRFDAYGIDEAAARALLLNWSVADRVISTVFVLGMPDLRALLFAPLGIYYSGSIIAAKVFTLLLTYGGIMLWYGWARRERDGESALIATGLLLISPALITQTDALGTGPYLLLCGGLAIWLERAYRQAQRPLGGYFFLQLLLIVFAVSLHPAALAYPLALLWEWQRNPVDPRQQRHAFIGIGVALIVTLLLRMGWTTQTWLDNPVLALGTAFAGPDATSDTLRWVLGVAGLAALTVITLAERHRLVQEFPGRLLLLMAIIGLIAADGAWALVALACLLYLGAPQLIAFNKLFSGQGFMGQRGLVMVVIFLIATIFMQADKGHQVALATNQLSASDQLILTLAAELEPEGKESDTGKADARIMSQWPGRTMLAVRRPTFPLPKKDYPDGAALLNDIKGITHLVFDPFAPRNRSLGANLSTLGGVTETLALQEGGVIIHIGAAPDAAAPGPSPAATATP